MSLWTIAWRNIQQRGLASTLTCLSMALGVMLVVTTLIALSVISGYFQRNMELNYNLIVGPKGDSLQLVLNTVYHLAIPVENVPYDVYQDFLPADHPHAKQEGGQGVAGPYAASVAHAIPLCMGDNFEGYRVVGTTSELLSLPYAEGRDYVFAEGRNFRDDKFFEGVVGAEVARRTGIRVGDEFEPSHGISTDASHTHEDKFRVVGILEPTGTPSDRALFVNMEGFYLLEGHSKDGESGHEDHGHSHSHGHSHDEVRKPLANELREVTSILVRTQGLFGGALANQINEGLQAQAAAPIGIITRLMTNFITPLQWLLLGLTSLIVLVSAVSILVSIYNSMSERKHDIAVMRALGASRGRVMRIILLESIILSVLGGVLGWLGAHVLVVLLNPTIQAWSGGSVGWFEFVSLGSLLQQATGTSMGSLAWVPVELVLVPLLVILAAIVGYLPALNAYSTDVAESL
jgi:putative ABC transport system permease protein